MTVAISGNQLALFLVVLARVGGLILSAPLVGDNQVPRQVKAALAIVLSVIVSGLPTLARAHIPVDLLPFVLLVVVQLVVGLAMGFLARILFLVITTAGEIISLQIGLSMAAVLSPMTKEPNPVLSQLYTVVVALTFLAVNGDAWVVASLARSFDLAPINSGALPPHLITASITTAMSVTAIGLQLAMPLVASLIASNIVMGLLSRSLPQLNLLLLNMPLDLLLGLLAIIGSLAGVMLMIDHMVNVLPPTMLDPLLHGKP